MADWRDDLVARHPALFTMETDGGFRPSGGYPEVGDGWRDLVERAAARLAEAVSGLPRGALVIVQIKEKFGTLRLYTSVAAEGLPEAVLERIDEAVALAEARSAVTCERCGDPGALWRDDGWYRTACARHGEGRKVAVKPGRDVLHRIGRRSGSLRWVRYDRATDAFVEVPEPSED